VYPRLTEIGPWEPVHGLAVFAFFMIVMVAWTYLERRARGEPLRLTLGLGLEVLVQAALPAALTYIVVNRLGPLEVRSYGVMMLLAFAAASVWMYRDRERYGFTGRQVFTMGLLGFAGGIVGSRIGFVLVELATGNGGLDLWHLLRGGMSWHGGLAGALVAVAIGARVTGTSFARIFDLSAPGVAVGYAIARIGCFLNGCCYGHECTLPWAVRFPAVGGDPAPPVPVHPTQLYSVVGTLAFTLPLLLRLTPVLRRPFDRFLGFLVLSSVVRFVVEFFRRGETGEPLAWLPALTVAQAASAGIIVIGTVVILLRERAAPGDPPSQP